MGPGAQGRGAVIARRPFHLAAGLLALLVCLPTVTFAQAAPISIGSAWDDVLQTAPQAAPHVALTVAQAPVSTGFGSDFGRHFFFQMSTEYVRQEISFSGLPTNGGVIDLERGPLAFTGGIPFREAFQPNADHLYSFINWGTRGWGSERVNTNFSFRYRQDLTHVEQGSPALSVVNAFRSNRLLELMSGTIEIHGLPGDGAFSRSSLQVGRQYVYGAELAALDGAQYTHSGSRYSMTLFGGRRFTYYGDPDQRALGGGNFRFNLGGGAGLEYQTLFYVRGSHVVGLHKRFEPNWFFKTNFKWIGGSPVDYRAQVMYAPPNGKTNVRASFLQKLTDNDFTYDYTILARDREPFNRFPALILGPISPWSQFVVDAHRELIPQVRVGGSFWIRHLNNNTEDQGPYDTSFEDYQVNVQVYPLRNTEILLELHQRNTDRLSPLGVTEFDDISRAGETKMQDISGEVRRSFIGGRLLLTAGAFVRRFDFQNRFFFIENPRVFGFLGGVSARLDPRTRLYFDYSLDDDFFVFRPSIQRAQVLRLGLDWRY